MENIRFWTIDLCEIRIGGVDLIKAIRVSSKDDVATVLSDVLAGEEVEILTEEMEPYMQITATEKIPFGNKIALKAIDADTPLLKYGYKIGITTQKIGLGDLVHIHNVRSEAVEIPSQIKEEIIRIMGIAMDNRRY